MPHTGANSVVDFLRSRGLQPTSGESFPFFDLRKRLFQQAGLTAEFGDFRGTDTQNLELFRRFEQAETNLGVNISPDNINRVFLADTTPGLTRVPTGSIGPGGEQIFDVFSGTRKLELGDPLLEGVNIAGLPEGKAPEGFVSKFKPVAPPPTVAPPTPTGEQITEPPPQVAGTEVSIPTPETGIPEGLVGLAEQATGGELPSPQEFAEAALKGVTEGALFPLQKEASEAQKAYIQFRAEAEKKNLLQGLAAKGIAQGGIAAGKVSDFEASKLAQLLGVDRKFAILIAKGIASSTQALVKEAQKDIEEEQSDARDALKALGFVVLPGGQVVQTPEAQRAETAEARRGTAERRAERADVRAEQRVGLDFIAEDRLQDKLTLDKLKFELSIQREARLAAGGGVDKESKVDIRNRREALAEELSALSDYDSREEAMKDISDNATALAVVLGQEGLEILIADVDRRFPAVPVPPTPEEVARRKPTAEQVGKQFIPALGQTVTSPSKGLLDITKGISGAAGEFLRGIFGFGK